MSAVLNTETRSYLLSLARYRLCQAVGAEVPRPSRPRSSELDQPARVFVSWHHGDRLVGCLGSLEATRSLEDAVCHYAIQAGLHDPRTPTPGPDEVLELRCEVSVLSAPRPLAQEGLEAIGRELEPGVDGVIVHAGSRRAVFLPVVWRLLPGRREFLEALCTKAGIHPEQTDPPVLAETFRTETFERGLP